MKRMQNYFSRPYTKRTPAQYKRMLSGFKKKYYRRRVK